MMLPYKVYGLAYNMYLCMYVLTGKIIYSVTVIVLDLVSYFIDQIFRLMMFPDFWV